jgi:hypothetical protein
MMNCTKCLAEFLRCRWKEILDRISPQARRICRIATQRVRLLQDPFEGALSTRSAPAKTNERLHEVIFNFAIPLNDSLGVHPA